jgi:hypothetical protein
MVESRIFLEKRAFIIDSIIASVIIIIGIIVTIVF